MNKIITGLIAAVVVLGIALVLLNNQLKPQAPGPMAVQQKMNRLPDLPEVEGAKQLMPLPTPPEAGRTGPAELASSANRLPPLESYVLHPAADSSRADARAEPATREEQPVATVIMPVDKPDTPPAEAQPAAQTPEPQSGAEKKAEAAPVISAAGKQAEKAPFRATDRQPEQPATVKTAAEKKAEPAPMKDPAVEKAPVRAADRQPEQPAAVEAAAERKAEPAPAKEFAAAKQPEVRSAAAERKSDEKKAAQPAKTPKITVFSRENGATVRISLDRDIRYRQILLDNPDRMVVDITGEWKQLRAPGVPANPLVTNVRLGHYDNRTRIVVDLSSTPRNHRVILSEDRQRLDIRVDK